MDDKEKAKKRIHIQRTFSYSRLGSEFMSAAYENLLPVQQMPTSAENTRSIRRRKEGRQWAV